MAYIRVYLNDVLQEQKLLGKELITIGRSPNSDIVLKNNGVSGLHAHIESHNGVYRITDQNSTNGVYVNHKRVPQADLKYWDEIQIYNYVLKFMPQAGLEGIDDPDLAKDSKQDGSHTMMIDVSNIADLSRLRSQRKQACLRSVSKDDEGEPIAIKEASFCIGKSPGSEMLLKGWFAPKVAATISRRHSGYYLRPQRGGRVYLNGDAQRSEFLLHDGDKLNIRGQKFIFYHRIDAEK